MQTLREKYERKITKITNQFFYVDNTCFSFEDFDVGVIKCIEEDHGFKEFRYCLYFLLSNSDISDPKGVWKNLASVAKLTDKDEKLKAIVNRCKILVAEDNEDIFDEIVYCIKYAINNQFIFYELGINREDWINGIIWSDNNRTKLHHFIENNLSSEGLGTRIVKFLIDKWFLPRYDLETVEMLIDKLKGVDKEKKSFFLRTIFKNKRFLLFACCSFILFLTIVNYEKWQMIDQFIENLLPLSNSQILSQTLNYDLRNWITIVWTFTAYLFVIRAIYQIARDNLKIKLYIPRLFAAIIIGYIPLFVGDEMWKFGMYADTLTVTVLVLSCLIISFLYLKYEISNNVEDKKTAFKRLWAVYTKGIMYSIISGIIILDIFCNTFYQNMKDDLTGYKNIFSGIFGIIDPKVLLVFFPLALLIGIFVQIIWEDKPITEPL